METLSCKLGSEIYSTLGYYSHLIPILLSAVLCIFVLSKANKSLLARILCIFSFSYCMWLLGDLVTWTSPNPFLIVFSWSILDYLNIIFYLFGAYFFSVFIREKDIPIWGKIIFFIVSLPPWIISFSNKSILAFNEAVCEAVNNEWLTQYKLIVEIAVVLYIVIIAVVSYLKSEKAKRKQITLISTALLLFFATFSITEYISSQTGIYEISLYSLFILPLFLSLIIYSITNLQIFKMKVVGTQLLVYVLLIMIGSQFFFLENTTHKILTVITFLISAFFGIILFRNVKKEQQARKEIERLASDLEKSNTRLKELDRQKTEFVSLASHQLRAPLTATKGYISMMNEGDYGEVPDYLKEPIRRIYSSNQSLVQIVGDFLDVSRIELGTMKYNFTDFDLSELLRQVTGELKPMIADTGLEFKLDIPEEKFPIKADQGKLKQVFNNLIDNALKYTKHGFVHVSLEKTAKGTYLFKVADSGVGINPEILPKLFEKFVRASNANEANVLGTGLGLYVVKQLLEKQGGTVWAESPGDDKGATFYVELPIENKIKQG